jgi:hypothetical protein
MTQPAKKPSPATMPKRAQPVVMGPDYAPKRRASGARKQVVQRLRTQRDDNIARSMAPPRGLTQRIGDLFPELKAI